MDQKKYTFDEAFEGALKYFEGDELAARVWVNKYAVKDSFGHIYVKIYDPVDALVGASHLVLGFALGRDGVHQIKRPVFKFKRIFFEKFVCAGQIRRQAIDIYLFSTHSKSVSQTMFDQVDR